MPFKNLVFLLSVFALIMISTGCKKCYTCQNSCVQCAITASGHTFSQVLCIDSFATTSQYDSAVANATAQGYTCAATAPTYTYDFCVNEPGNKADYVNYFNHGGRAPCVAK